MALSRTKAREFTRSGRAMLAVLFLVECMAIAGCQETEFEKANKLALGHNPDGAAVELSSANGRNQYHLNEPISVKLRFTGKGFHAFSIELGDQYNAAGPQTDQFEVDRKTDVMVTSKSLAAWSYVCCASKRPYLGDDPKVLQKDLTEYLRFRKPGRYEVVFTTRRVFHGLGPTGMVNFYSRPSDFVLTSNVLKLEILPADPVVEQRGIDEISAAIESYKKATENVTQTKNQLMDTGRVPQSMADLARKCEFLETEPALRKRIELAELFLPRSQFGGVFMGEQSLWMPLWSSTHPEIVASILQEQAQDPSFPVDEDFLLTWAQVAARRDNPEILSPGSDIQEVASRHSEYHKALAEEEGKLASELEASLSQRTGVARSVTAATVTKYKRYSAIQLGN